MMHIFAKDRVWLLRGLADHEMSCVRLESEHQNNATLEGGCQQSSHFCQIQLYSSWEHQKVFSSLCLVMTPKIFSAKLEFGTCLLVHYKDIFSPCSLIASHIPSIPLFHPYFFVNYCWLIVSFLQVLKSNGENRTQGLLFQTPSNVG